MRTLHEDFVIFIVVQLSKNRKDHK